ncbi:MAG TPA: PD-(D/E)XK nuclease family protein, partial [Gemmatimonadales bacterium]|nr:PD-(D/E)XK nuclease family protein [Gemmatimonadales bacterium]
MGGELFTISWSKIAAFERCRKQFWYRYVSGMPSPRGEATPAGLVGQAVHRGMKALCDTGEPEDGIHEMETYLRMPSHECAGPGTDGWQRAFGYFEHGVQAHESID